jgi:hypothetical protein
MPSQIKIGCWVSGAVGPYLPVPPECGKGKETETGGLIVTMIIEHQ